MSDETKNERPPRATHDGYAYPSSAIDTSRECTHTKNGMETCQFGVCSEEEQEAGREAWRRAQGETTLADVIVRDTIGSIDAFNLEIRKRALERTIVTGTLVDDLTTPSTDLTPPAPKAEGVKHDSGKLELDLIPPNALRAALSSPLIEQNEDNDDDRALIHLLDFAGGKRGIEALADALADLIGGDTGDATAERLQSLARVLQFGAKKYGRHNWMGGLKYTRLIAAAMRHLFASNNGAALDSETSLPHRSHAACCVAFLYEVALHRPDLDDRDLEKWEVSK